jgi:Flp pilus assembly protein TadD
MASFLERVMHALHGRRRELTASLVSDPPAPPAEWIEQELSKGIDLEDRGKPEASLEVYGAIIARAPDCARAYLNLGNALSSLGRIEEAEGAYRHAISLDGSSAPAHHNLGNLLLSGGDASGAVLSYREAARSRPDWAEPLIGLASALDECGRSAKSEEAYRAALELEPRHEGAVLNYSRLLLGLGRSDDAMKALDDLIAAGVGSRAVLRRKMEILRQIGEAGRALDVGASS